MNLNLKIILKNSKDNNKTLNKLNKRSAIKRFQTSKKLILN